MLAKPGEDEAAHRDAQIRPDADDGVDADDPRQLQERLQCGGDAGTFAVEQFLEQDGGAFFISR